MQNIKSEYDVGAAFAAIENELMQSMIRNMSRHKQEEIDEGKRWSMWQAEELHSLEKYRKENQKKFQKDFKRINDRMEGLIREAKSEGEMKQEIAILEAIKQGFPAKRVSKGMTAEFFRLNERKLDALIKATTSDMKRAEVAILRMANDRYRKAIFNAQVYANTGAGTYEKAVDMATKDMLSSGLNCVEYANGARHTLADYADMAIRTACKRAYLQGEGEKRQEWGITTVIINRRTDACPLCMPFEGVVMIDDVWSGGSKEDGKYPLLSDAIAAGLYHPRCRDSHTTYFPGISTAPDNRWTKRQIADVEEQAKQEARQQYAKRQADKYQRLADGSLDPENKEQYQRKAEQWEEVQGKTNEITEEVADKYSDIINVWKQKKPSNSGKVTDAVNFVFDNAEYTVNGKTVVLDYSQKEKKIAELVNKTFGLNVEMVPRVLSPQGISTPDYLIEGNKYDLKEPIGKGKNVLYGMVAKKKKQADNFIFDISQCPLEILEINRQIDGLYLSNRTSFINNIIVVKDDEVIHVYKRN